MWLRTSFVEIFGRSFYTGSLGLEEGGFGRFIAGEGGLDLLDLEC